MIPKGSGSENGSFLRMCVPADGLDRAAMRGDDRDVRERVDDVVVRAARLVLEREAQAEAVEVQAAPDHDGGPVRGGAAGPREDEARRRVELARERVGRFAAIELSQQAQPLTGNLVQDRSFGRRKILPGRENQRRCAGKAGQVLDPAVHVARVRVVAAEHVDRFFDA